MTRTSLIHPTAVVDPEAEIDDNVEIGPFAVIEAGVRIESGTTVGPHVHIQGMTEIGPDNKIFTGCALGLPPQHTDYAGAPTKLVIGRGNTIREYVSIHRAFEEGHATVIGDDCFLMGFSHAAHDCEIGSGVIIANGVLLAGHVTVGDRAFLSGFVGVHQFCRVGRLAMVGGSTPIRQDVPPFMIVQGDPPRIRTLNTVGLQRAGLDADRRKDLKKVFRRLYRTEKNVRAVLDELRTEELSPEARELVDFYGEKTRGVVSHLPAKK